MRKQYDTILFDLDGTLLNTLEDLADSVNFILNKHGFPARTLEEIRLFVGNGIEKLVERSLPLGLDQDRFLEIFLEFREYYSHHCQNKTRVYDDILSMLACLKEQGYRLGIVSNKNQAAVTVLYEKYFQDCLELAIGQREGVRKKPAPDMIWQALKELHGEKEKCLYVGDSDVDYETAENAQMDVVLVTWGFRKPSELAACHPKGWMKTPLELITFLEK